MAGRLLAMWSGPRNISTAMMRAWENRSDTEVIDEPLYAHYLASTGIDHPLAADIIASGDTDWRRVTEGLSTAPASGIYYQKHITTHLLEHIDLDWIDPIDHVMLIRDPARVVASYTRKRERCNAQDLGYDRQRSLFEEIGSRRREWPPVIDADLFLARPEAQLRALCARLRIAFDPDMLRWPTGERASDGIWHRHWYDAVKGSSGFAPPRDEPVLLDEQAQAVADTCQDDYLPLRQHAIQ